MRDQAVGAVLHPALQNTVIAAALIKKIQRTKAEQAIELLRFGGSMAREILTIPITEKAVAVVHGYLN